MSFTAYPSYKDCGVEWLGEVPSHWTVCQTKREFRSLKVTNTGMMCEERLALTMNGVVPRDLGDLDGLQSSDYEGYQIFEAGDLAFKLIDLQNVKTSRVGMVPYRGIMSPAYIRLEPASPEVGRYGFWYFMALYWTQVFNNLGGGVRQTLGPQDLLTVPFPLPPLSEQVAIAAFLDRETTKIDGLIHQQRLLIGLLKEKRQAVISHAVTKGLDRAASMRDSGLEWLDEVPAHWEIRKLRDLTRKIGDGLHGTPQYDDESECHFINGNNLVNGAIRFNDSTRTVDRATADEHRNDLDSQTILMSINGTIGNLALYHGEDIILGKSAAFISCRACLDREFLYFVLQSAYSKKYFNSTMANTTIYNLSLEAIRGLRVGLPAIDEQAVIAKALRSALFQFDDLIGATERAIFLLQERRAALISAAVTGKIDVRGLAVIEREREAA